MKSTLTLVAVTMLVIGAPSLAADGGLSPANEKVLRAAFKAMEHFKVPPLDGGWRLPTRSEPCGGGVCKKCLLEGEYRDVDGTCRRFRGPFD